MKYSEKYKERTAYNGIYYDDLTHTVESTPEQERKI